MKRLGILACVLLVTGCGTTIIGDGPEKVAQDFARAWTEARCDAAMTWVQAPDPSWKDACKRAFHFGTKCDEVQPGDPPPVDCGPRTKIAVRDTQVTATEYADDGSARLSVLVSYTQGKTTRESRTLRLKMAETDGWKITRVG